MWVRGVWVTHPPCSYLPLKDSSVIPWQETTNGASVSSDQASSQVWRSAGGKVYARGETWLGRWQTGCLGHDGCHLHPHRHPHHAMRAPRHEIVRSTPGQHDKLLEPWKSNNKRVHTRFVTEETRHPGKPGPQSPEKAKMSTDGGHSDSGWRGNSIPTHSLLIRPGNLIACSVRL